MALWGGNRWKREDKESVGTIEESERDHVSVLVCVPFSSELLAGVVAENGGQRT